MTTEIIESRGASIEPFIRVYILAYSNTIILTSVHDAFSIIFAKIGQMYASRSGVICDSNQHVKN